MSIKRNTIQKIKIMEFLTSVHIHPTAEMVYEAVKKDLPNISLATVYRNLNQMALGGEIIRLEVNGEYRFDGDKDKHQHYYCSNCGNIVDVYNEKVNNYAIKHASLEGFEVSIVQILYKGFCSNCKNEVN